MLTTQNTKLWLPFEGDANDSSGNGNNGTANAITYAAGEVGRCAVFNGSTSYVSCPAMNMSENMSFVIDIYLNSTTGIQHIVTNRSSFNTGFALFFNTAGIIFDFGSSAYRWTTNVFFSIGRTQIVIARSSAITKLYKNGKFLNSTDTTGVISNSTANVNIGRDPMTSTYYLNGKLNSVQIYNAFINEDNALRIYNGLHPLF